MDHQQARALIGLVSALICPCFLPSRTSVLLYDPIPVVFHYRSHLPERLSVPVSTLRAH